LRFNEGLKSLILSSTNLNDKSFQVLVKSLPATLRKLDLSRNPSLTIKSYQLLSEANCKIKSYNFEGNSFGDDVCEVVCSMVSDIVTSLNLSKCSITDYGAVHIG
jgi:hypothetical protein